MSKKRLKEIEHSAEEIVKSFVEVSKGLPVEKETYYSHDLRNIMRPDGKPSPDKELAVFREAFLKIVPASDEEGSLRVEVAKWTE